MTDLQPVTKTCTICGQPKNAAEFYARKDTKDRLSPMCKPCGREQALVYASRRRERMGDEAWLAHGREVARRSRENPDRREREKVGADAYRAALSALVDMYPAAFAALVRVERSRRGLDPEATRTKRT